MTPKEMLEITIDELVKAGPSNWTKGTFWQTTDGRKIDVFVARTYKSKNQPIQACMVGRVALERKISINLIEYYLVKALNHDHSPTVLNDKAENFNSLITTLKSYLEKVK
jgi:hypothetical protein